MFKSIFKFHRDLITPTSTISSSRYIALMSFYVSSWMLGYIAWKTKVLPSELYIAYASIYVLGYLGSKGIAAYQQNVQTPLNTPPNQEPADGN